MMKKGFTLLELVVVIIILGVLATLGITQYGKMVEKGRWAEAYQIIGDMRKLAIAYRLANGTVNGMTNADVNVGPSADQIPDSCRSTHYFYYKVDIASDTLTQLVARRCSPADVSGGKSPDYRAYYLIWDEVNFVTGTDTWRMDHWGD